MANWISLPPAQNLELWTEVLKKELKTDNVERVLSRSTAEGLKHSLLTVEAPSWFDARAKQAALSYTWTKKSELKWQTVAELYKQGVWDFILDPELLGLSDQELLQELQKAEVHCGELGIRLWVHHASLKLPKFACRIVSASESFRQGASSSLEMGFVLDQVIAWAKTNPQESIAVALYAESALFQSIAKLRAMKAITEAALTAIESAHLLSRIAWMARPAWREFTAFDASNNILRNATSLVAGYLSGAHVVESLPYDLLLEESSEREQVQRIALTSQLVLSSEASLSEVMDPSAGSYFLEDLTRKLGQAAWGVMQKLSGLSSEEKKNYLKAQATEHWSGLLEKYRTRKLVQTGVNDFPLVTDAVKIAKPFQENDHVRLAREFEELRLSLKNKPKVALAVVGDYAALQARLNFSKNYFEILGLTVSDPQRGLALEEAKSWLKQEKPDVVVWVSSDEEHAKLSKVTDWTYVAGKTQVDGCRNIFAGQNVYQTLKELAEGWKA